MSEPLVPNPPQRGRPGPLRTWVLAARPPTLTAALAPVAVGVAVALRHDTFRAGPAFAALLGAIAIQVGANFANDLSDFRRGADAEGRLGPMRVTQQGLLTERQVVAGVYAAFSLATLAGLYLTWVAGWPVIAIGLGSMLGAVLYTGGPLPYGYRGLGEVFTFVFFGVVAVTGTYFVQARELTPDAFLASVPVGLTVTAILVVNNVRDIESDRRAGKRTLAVLLGRPRARLLFVAMLGAAYLVAAGLWLLGDFPSWTLLAWASAPFAVAPAAAVLSRVDGPALNGALRATARLHLIFALLFSAGLAR